MGPTFVSKVANFTNLGQGLSKKVGFFLIFEQIVRPGFFDKMLGFWLFGLFYFHNYICLNII